MNRFTPVVAALTLAACTSFAQTAPVQSVEVRGNAVRTDVRTLCPAVDAELHDALVKAVQNVATAALMDVRFELQGSRVGQVDVGAGPIHYQRALRRAVRALQCEAKETASQTVALRVRFVDPFDSSAHSSAAATNLVLVSASAPAR